jgi:hypothetical protein
VGSAAAAGELTRRRAAIVNNRHLAEAAAAAGLDAYIKATSKPLLTGIKRFAAAIAADGDVENGGSGGNRTSGGGLTCGDGDEQGIMDTGVAGGRGNDGVVGTDEMGVLGRLQALNWGVADEEVWRDVGGGPTVEAGSVDLSRSPAVAGSSHPEMMTTVDVEMEVEDEGTAQLQGVQQQEQQQAEEEGQENGAAAAAAPAVVVVDPGQRRYPKALADVVESIIGAVFVDKAVQQGSEEAAQPWLAVWKIARSLVGLP